MFLFYDIFVFISFIFFSILFNFHHVFTKIYIIKNSFVIYLSVYRAIFLNNYLFFVYLIAFRDHFY